MTRGELEAVIWRQLGAYATTVIVDRLLAAADDYAVSECGLTSERRAELRHAKVRDLRAAVKATHIYPGDYPRTPCGVKPSETLLMTTDPEKVTCSRCRKHQEALGAVAS